jgi:predicted flap endonuclease-1-like 5' DNA nuclease
LGGVDARHAAERVKIGVALCNRPRMRNHERARSALARRNSGIGPGPGHRQGETMAVENDLSKLKGIGPKYAEMLKSIGVDSIKELRHRNAAHLKEMIESRHGKVVGLSENECKTWIDEAKAFEL